MHGSHHAQDIVQHCKRQRIILFSFVCVHMSVCLLAKWTTKEIIIKLPVSNYWWGLDKDKSDSYTWYTWGVVVADTDPYSTYFEHLHVAQVPCLKFCFQLIESSLSVGKCLKNPCAVFKWTDVPLHMLNIWRQPDLRCSFQTSDSRSPKCLKLN